MTNALTSFIIPLLNSFSALILALYFYKSFSQGDKKGQLLLMIGSFIAFSASLIFVKTAYLNFIITTLCTYLYTYAYRMKQYNRILLTFSYVAINSLTEILSALSIMAFFNIGLQDIKTSWFNLLGIVLSKVIAFFIMTIIIYSKHRLLFGKFREYWIYLYSLPFATFFVIVTMHYSLYHFSDNHSLKIISAISMILLIASNLLIFKITDKMHNAIVTENKLSFAEELIRKQSEQYKQIFYNNQNIIKIKHDYKNALIGLLSEIESGNYSGVKQKLTSDLMELEGSDYKAITGNSAIDVVLTYKLNEATSRGITVNHSCHNIPELNISGIDISILIGNALDNAIEALDKLPDTDKKEISITIIYKNNRIWFTITNNVKENININNLSTDKPRSEYHGIGIITMKTIVEKYQGEIYFECENNLFKTLIILCGNND